MNLIDRSPHYDVERRGIEKKKKGSGKQFPKPATKSMDISKIPRKKHYQTLNIAF